MGRSHKNDKRRLTARERAEEYAATQGNFGPHESTARLAKAFAAHARATLARYKAKVRRG